MKMLRQIRKLGLTRVKREHGSSLSAAIEEMKHLENLNVTTISEDEIIDLNFTSSPPQLQWLHLKARLQKLPSWIPELECLVKVRLGFSMLKDDPLLSLKSLPNLLNLCLWDNCYDGEILHFQKGGFQKLMTLNLSRLNRVNSVVIDSGTCLSVEHLTLEKIPQLEELPSGIKHMHNLKDIYFTDMPAEFVESIDPGKGKDYSIIKHVPLVFVRHWYGQTYMIMIFALSTHPPMRLVCYLASFKMQRYLSSDHAMLLFFIFTIPDFSLFLLSCIIALAVCFYSDASFIGFNEVENCMR